VIPCEDSFLLALLMSKLHWFLIAAMAPAVRGGFYELRAQYMETLPIPKTNKTEQQVVADLASSIQGLAEDRFKLEADFRHRIACDLAGSSDAKLNKKLHDWYHLDAVQFRKEVKKCFKADIPLAERSDWEAYLQAQSQKVADFNAQIQNKEIELNQHVYALFKLKTKEITLIEAAM
jgi:hypothetical protein